ncbi:class II aldolase/adducin family protein [Pseudobacteroides cellulosolvens]|uniref:L-fuculose-phosphate aldolase n=1 Tax=Pseudobacteroides cellulosolvens ATCC 35603 = DSM 2933 TaxID=398512 RepID=A0A0L6JMS6_9FIRM|nr:class II aldolase/adducin family protein [Pseudobacteroides cellulosolvens]KNY27101.1 L-fuculose-phosphate aldolase [Pseudobacteroides cellulosolvens ATCC 35603 = DSM 2933]
MLEHIKSQLIEIAKLAYNKEMVNTYEGNISIRNGNYICITPSGFPKCLLKEEKIPVIDLDGNVIEGNLKPSSEWKLHALSYINRPDINGIIHSHSPYTTAYAVANKSIETKAYPEMIVFFDKIPLAAYGTQSTDDIFRGVEEFIANYDVILLANHGVLSMGEDVYKAFYKLEAAESIAKVLILSEMLGGGKALSEENLEQLYRIRKGNPKL